LSKLLKGRENNLAESNRVTAKEKEIMCRIDGCVVILMDIKDDLDVPQIDLNLFYPD